MRTFHHPACHEIVLPEVLSALGAPLRLRIVRDLSRVEEASCSVFYTGIAKSTLSHHLKVLREAGIIQTRSEGTYLFLSLRRQDLDARFPGLLDAILQADEASSAGTGAHYYL